MLPSKLSSSRVLLRMTGLGLETLGAEPEGHKCILRSMKTQGLLGGSRHTVKAWFRTVDL